MANKESGACVVPKKQSLVPDGAELDSPLLNSCALEKGWGVVNSLKGYLFWTKCLRQHVNGVAAPSKKE